MRQLPYLLRRALFASFEDGLFTIAKGAAYSALLSFFPILATVATVFVQIQANFVRANVVAFLAQILPPGTDEIVLQQFRVRGQRPITLLIVAIALSLWAASSVIKSLIDGFNAAYSFSGDGKVLVAERTGLTMPGELFVAAGDGSGLKQLTHENDSILASVEMNAPETFWFEGAEGTRVQAMIIRPPQSVPTKKYPMLVLLHGGPQTMWSNAWGYRWNAQVFSGAGYVTLMINRRGSTGYGQKFTDQITNDWGGRAYADVMKGIDAAIVKYPYIDKTKMAAAGGSYGGYMADWLATHTDRFKAIVSHAGVYDKVSM